MRNESTSVSSNSSTSFVASWESASLYSSRQRSKHAIIRRNRWLNMKAELERVGALGMQAHQENHEITRDCDQDAVVQNTMIPMYPRVPANFFEFSDEEEQKEESDFNEVEAEKIDLFNQLVQQIVEERHVEDAHVGRAAGRKFRRPNQPKTSRSPPRQNRISHKGAEARQNTKDNALKHQAAQGSRASNKRNDNEGKQPIATISDHEAANTVTNKRYTVEQRSRSWDEPALRQGKDGTGSAEIGLHDRQGDWMQNKDNARGYTTIIENELAEEEASDRRRQDEKRRLLKEKRRLEKEKMKLELQKEKARLQEKIAAAEPTIEQVDGEGMAENSTHSRPPTKREEMEILLQQKKMLEEKARGNHMEPENQLEPSEQINEDEIIEMSRREKLRAQLSQWFGMSRHVARVVKKAKSSVVTKAMIDGEEDNQDIGEMLDVQGHGSSEENHGGEGVPKDSGNRDSLKMPSSLRSAGRTSLVAAVPVVASRRIDSHRRSKSEDITVKVANSNRMMLPRQKSQGSGHMNRARSPPKAVKPRQDNTKREVLDPTSQGSVKMRQLTRHIKENAPLRTNRRNLKPERENVADLVRREDAVESNRVDGVANNHSNHVLDKMQELAAVPENQEDENGIPMRSHIHSPASDHALDEKNEIVETPSCDTRDVFDEVWESEVFNRILLAKQEAKAEIDKQVSRTLAELDAIKATAVANVQHAIDHSEPSGEGVMTGADHVHLLESLQQFESEILTVVRTATSADGRAATAEKMLKEVKIAHQQANRRAMANKLRPQKDLCGLEQIGSTEVNEALASVLSEIVSAGETAKTEIDTYLRKAMLGLQDVEKEAIKAVQRQGIHSQSIEHISNPSPSPDNARQHATASLATDIEKSLKRLDFKLVLAHRRAHSAEVKAKAAEKQAKEADAKRKQAERREKANAALKEHDFQTRLYMMRKPKGEASLDASISSALGKLEKAKSTVDETVQRVLEKLETVEFAAAASLKQDRPYRQSFSRVPSDQVGDKTQGANLIKEASPEPDQETKNDLQGDGIQVENLEKIEMTAEGSTDQVEMTMWPY